MTGSPKIPGESLEIKAISKVRELCRLNEVYIAFLARFVIALIIHELRLNDYKIPV